MLKTYLSGIGFNDVNFAGGFLASRLVFFETFLLFLLRTRLRFFGRFRVVYGHRLSFLLVGHLARLDRRELAGEIHQNVFDLLSNYCAAKNDRRVVRLAGYEASGFVPSSKLDNCARQTALTDLQDAAYEQRVEDAWSKTRGYRE